MNLVGSARIWLVLGTTDMRKSIDSLAVLVGDQLELDVFSGHRKRQIAPICSDEGMRCIPSEISGSIFLFRGAKLRDRLRFLRRGAFQRG